MPRVHDPPGRPLTCDGSNESVTSKSSGPVSGLKNSTASACFVLRMIDLHVAQKKTRHYEPSRIALAVDGDAAWYQHLTNLAHYR